MIYFNQPVGFDSELIYFILIEFEDTTYKISSKGNVLSGWKAVLIEDFEIKISSDYLGIEKGINFGDDITIVIPRYLTNDYFSSFHNSLYPVIGKSKFLNNKVKIGVGWDGIYNENQITWIFEGRIADYTINYDSLEFTVLDNIGNYEIDVPNELLSKYEFPNIPDENVGKPKPIVFGKLDYSFLYYESGTNNLSDRSYLCKAFLVDKINGIYYISQFESNNLPINYSLNYGLGAISGIVFLVYYENDSGTEVAITNKILAEGGIILNDSDGYRIQLLQTGINDLRLYWKYRFKNLFKYKAQNSYKLIEKTNMDYVYFGAGSVINLEFDNLFNKDMGLKVNDNYALMMHTVAGSNVATLSFYNKKNDSYSNYYNLNTVYPKTMVLNYLPADNISDYCLNIYVNNLLQVSRIYYIAFDVPVISEDKLNG